MGTGIIDFIELGQKSHTHTQKKTSQIIATNPKEWGDSDFVIATLYYLKCKVFSTNLWEMQREKKFGPQHEKNDTIEDVP